MAFKWGGFCVLMWFSPPECNNSSYQCNLGINAARQRVSHQLKCKFYNQILNKKQETRHKDNSSIDSCAESLNWNLKMSFCWSPWWQFSIIQGTEWIFSINDNTFAVVTAIALMSNTSPKVFPQPVHTCTLAVWQGSSCFKEVIFKSAAHQCRMAKLPVTSIRKTTQMYLYSVTLGHTRPGQCGGNINYPHRSKASMFWDSHSAALKTSH